MVCTSRYVKERAGDCVEKIEKRRAHPYRRVHDCFMDENTWNKDDNYKLCKNSMLRHNIKRRGNYLCFIETVFGNNFIRIRLTFDACFVYRAFT